MTLPPPTPTPMRVIGEFYESGVYEVDPNTGHTTRIADILPKISELMPCPFCGGAAEMHKDRTGKRPWFQVHCTECDSSTHCAWTEEKVAVEKWNSRKHTPNKIFSPEDLFHLFGEAINDYLSKGKSKDVILAQLDDFIKQRDQSIAAPLLERIKELEIKNADLQDDYLRRHKDACDRAGRILVLEDCLMQATKQLERNGIVVPENWSEAIKPTPEKDS